MAALHTTPTNTNLAVSHDRRRPAATEEPDNQAWKTKTHPFYIVQPLIWPKGKFIPPFCMKGFWDTSCKKVFNQGQLCLPGDIWQHQELLLPLTTWEQRLGCLWNSLQPWSPAFLAPGPGFVEDSFAMDQGWGDGYIYCALYYYYISSISDHQALDPRYVDIFESSSLKVFL